MKQIHVLVVDDDTSIREYLEDVLREEGHIVITAANGELGIRALQEHPELEFLITDYQMPKRNGIEVVRFSKLERPSVKTALITATPTPDVAKLAMAAGADAVLSKPFRIEALEELIAKFFPVTSPTVA